mmetsp:Transcript_4990/g.12157  ORF Transcript_4990/g.12157 Transcript_4990/m.12157 type:complete len:233 (-) Transcript_4990:453-1151(-)
MLSLFSSLLEPPASLFAAPKRTASSWRLRQTHSLPEPCLDSLLMEAAKGKVREGKPSDRHDGWSGGFPLAAGRGACAGIPARSIHAADLGRRAPLSLVSAKKELAVPGRDTAAAAVPARRAEDGRALLPEPGRGSVPVACAAAWPEPPAVSGRPLRISTRPLASSAAVLSRTAVAAPPSSPPASLSCSDSMMLQGPGPSAGPTVRQSTSRASSTSSSKCPALSPGETARRSK